MYLSSTDIHVVVGYGWGYNTTTIVRNRSLCRMRFGLHQVKLNRTVTVIDDDSKKKSWGSAVFVGLNIV